MLRIRMYLLLVGLLPVWLLGQPADFVVVKPATQGFAPKKLAAVDDLLQTAVDSQWVAGAVALVARRGEIVYEKAFGYRNLESQDPMETGDLFRIASMTKPITSLAALQLYEQRGINFSDPVGRYLPSFEEAQVLDSLHPDGSWEAHPADEEVTIHHLLTHTSGISYAFSDPLMRQIYGPAGIIELTTPEPVRLETNIAKLGTLPLKHEPGAAWTYGLSVDVLGRVIEVSAGEPLDVFFRTHIFEPLGMEDTDFYLEADQADRLTSLYGNHPQAKLFPYPNDGSRGFPGDYPLMGAQTYFSGGAGLVSTARDYLRFCQAILNGGELFGQRIIEAETLQHMLENKIGDLRVGTDLFSYGFAITPAGTDLPYGRRPGRLSWSGYFQTLFWIDQEREVVGILLTQVVPSSYRDRLFHGFEAAVNAAIKE
ncbi:MAG: class A beta-lactamase-related serine hydrolase [Bacteroidetes bacterium]|nr:MAG: class A beta-lactamase-related serine hydrolase [Bacteroidota bacterium]